MWHSTCVRNPERLIKMLQKSRLAFSLFQSKTPIFTFWTCVYWYLRLSSPSLTGEVQIDGWSAQTPEIYRGKEGNVTGSRGYGGIGFHSGSQGRERKPGAESKLCGQTLTDALGTVSATSAAHGSLLEFHLSVTHPRVQLLLCIAFSVSVYALCVSYL